MSIYIHAFKRFAIQVELTCDSLSLNITPLNLNFTRICMCFIEMITGSDCTYNHWFNFVGLSYWLPGNYVARCFKTEGIV